MALRASITVGIPLEMNEDLDRSAQALNMSVSRIVRTLLQAHLEDDPRMFDPEQFRETYKPGHEYKRRNGSKA